MKLLHSIVLITRISFEEPLELLQVYESVTVCVDVRHHLLHFFVGDFGSDRFHDLSSWAEILPSPLVSKRLKTFFISSESVK
ncbi:hypothetical protein HanPSC8_Chr15g0660581 [Helianthus annuus]|nr:hypothetical protein HanPSC8_Chr15g0660581 [Helianthus annuus]